MATEASQPLKISVEAAGDISASQYLFMKYDASGHATVITSATDKVIGVLQNKPKAAGHMAEIVVAGVTKVIAPGAVAIGAYVGPDSAGKCQSITVQGYGASYVQGTKQILGYKYESPGHEGAAATSDKFSAVIDCTTTAPGT